MEEIRELGSHQLVTIKVTVDLAKNHEHMLELVGENLMRNGMFS